ncbi:fimbria/pilus periplasmic chaperone [Pseudoalteromonas sp. PS5]|uniref:fimbrial biogenesis chaperone n=1 Tax=Pseudoalteromonas sp. PS5 TaxID=1437473 RepID=UPI000FFF5E53|nr:fimbria/pilus periplasmic chaperone [Pseudoalteromonas sp. PS5]RXE97488.1 molecular chaperone [Pseudoalteromonas sp. PS5]
MMKYIVFLFSVFVSVFSTFSYANLLISPTRVVFDERTRTAEIVVLNNSSVYQSYRLSWEEKQALPSGGYKLIQEENAINLSSMARVSPSQMRLAPGQRQVVKIALRKPRALGAGEYRSHLLFQALPNGNDGNGNQGTIKLDIALNYSLPIMARHKIDTPNITITTVDVTDKVTVGLSKTGVASAFGTIEAFFKPQGVASAKRVAITADYTVHTELERAQAQLTLLPRARINAPGILEIRFTGSGEYKRHVFAEKAVILK